MTATNHDPNGPIVPYQATSIFAPMFWLGFLAALPAGYLAAWPVNYWLLKRNVKKPCH